MDELMVGESLEDSLLDDMVDNDGVVEPEPVPMSAREAAKANAAKLAADKKLQAAWACAWCKCSAAVAGRWCDGPMGKNTLCGEW